MENGNEAGSAPLAELLELLELLEPLEPNDGIVPNTTLATYACAITYSSDGGAGLSPTLRGLRPVKF